MAAPKTRMAGIILYKNFRYLILNPCMSNAGIFCYVFATNFLSNESEKSLKSDVLNCAVDYRGIRFLLAAAPSK
jgi:hypothetical protein